MSSRVIVHKLKVSREGMPAPPACLTDCLIPHRIRFATRIGTALQHPSTGFADDHAIQAGALPPLGVGLYLMAPLTERLEYLWSNAPLGAHQTGMVGRWEAGVREAIAIEARRLDGFLWVKTKLHDVQEDLQGALRNVITAVAAERDHGLSVFQHQGRRRGEARTLARCEGRRMTRLDFGLRTAQTQGQTSTGDNRSGLGPFTRGTGKDIAVAINHSKIRRSSRLVPCGTGNSNSFSRGLWSTIQRGTATTRVTGWRHGRPGALRVDELATFAQVLL